MNPGSKEAIEAGCKCPVLDNAHGRGAWGSDATDRPVFWISADCPLHRSDKAKEADGQLNVLGEGPA